MAGRNSKFEAALAVVLLAAGFWQSSLAATYTVGGSSGWRIPSSSSFYSDWSQNITFHVGDTLVFNFNNGAHDVATVNKSAYDGCVTSNTLSLQSTPPVSITLNSTGHQYYICGFPGHCSSGQKLHVQVSSGSASPSSSPSTTPSSASPSDTSIAPAPSSASSTGASFLAIFAGVAAVYNLVVV